MDELDIDLAAMQVSEARDNAVDKIAALCMRRGIRLSDQDYDSISDYVSDAQEMVFTITDHIIETASRHFR